MSNCNGAYVSIAKGDKYSKEQCTKTDFEQQQMQSRPYVSLVDNLMYVQGHTLILP